MSLQPDRHPTESDLLLLADGELHSRRSEAVRRHLEECWSCRAKFDHLQSTITAFVDYRENFLYPAIPPPPLPPRSLDSRLSELEKGLSNSWTARLRADFRRVPLARVLASGVVMAACVALFLRTGRQEVVSANDVVRRSLVAERVHKPVRQRVRIRRGSVAVTRDLWRDGDSRALPVSSPARPTDLDRQIDAMLTRVGWDAGDPLSARNFAEWRGSIRQQQEFVEQQPGYLSVRTVSADDDIAEARITVREQDYRAVEQRLNLRNNDEIEIRELDYELGAMPPRLEPPPATASVPPVPAAISLPESAPAQPPSPPDPGDAEVSVRYAFHSIGADLGDPIEVRRDRAGRLVVEAIGVDEQKLAAVREAVGDVPVVTTAEGGTSAESPAVDVSSLVPGKPLDAIPVLDRQFITPEKRVEFGNAIIKISRSVLSRAYALRNLAEIYSPPIIAKLTPESRKRILEMRDHHAEALRRDVPMLAASFYPILSDIGSPPAAAGSGWQETAKQLFLAVRDVDAMCNVLFAGGNTNLNADEVLVRVARSLAGADQILSQWNDVFQKE